MKKITCNCGTQILPYTTDGRRRSHCVICLEPIDNSNIPPPTTSRQEKLRNKSLPLKDSENDSVHPASANMENHGKVRTDVALSSERPKRVNSLGIVSLILSLIALSLASCSSTILKTLQARKIPDREYRTDDLRVITDKAANAFTLAEQVVVFLVGGLMCGTIGLISFTLGCVALVRSPRIAAAIGVVLSLVTFGVLLP